MSYKNGDRVQVALYGNLNEIILATIVGLVANGINPLWIIEPDQQRGNFKCLTMFESFIRPEGSNKLFACELKDYWLNGKDN